MMIETEAKARKETKIDNEIDKEIETEIGVDPKRRKNTQIKIIIRNNYSKRTE